MTQKNTHTITLPLLSSFLTHCSSCARKHDTIASVALRLAFASSSSSSSSSSLSLPSSLPTPPFLLLLLRCCYPWTRCRRRHSSYSSILHSNSRQSAADFKTPSTKTLSVISLFPLFPHRKKRGKKKKKKYRKRHPIFFPSLVQCPYAFSLKLLQLRLCNNLLREMLARSTSVATSRSVPLVRSSAAVCL